jgi:hypothetical protein
VRASTRWPSARCWPLLRSDTLISEGASVDAPNALAFTAAIIENDANASTLLSFYGLDDQKLSFVCKYIFFWSTVLTISVQGSFVLRPKQREAR